MTRQDAAAAGDQQVAQETSDTDPLWYKDATIYQLHVRAFCDSGEDGIGDFAGLTQKLDYLQELGVTAVWLLPFYPSPLRDDGYDIADYTDVNPAYGTLKDFKQFLREAHARGLKVITELVLNHTSDQHPWFQRARRAKPGSAARDFYVWSDTPQKYQDARIIFKDFETSNWTWDGVAGAYYWHRFYTHQPDLNFENPQVQQALLQVLEFWLKMGVDGLRLDAVPYLYEREGTNCENLPETHAFLKKLRAHIDARFSGRMLLAEANQWPEDAIAYFGDGDECHAAFHFPVMPRMYMAIHTEDRFPIVDILQQTPAIPHDCQWFVFLRNHDELTLEMVTDEERDTMYRVYAHDRQARINLGIRRRLAPLLNNNRRRIELMNGLLFALPGTPVIYYGDEIGMGDNIYLGDRDGVRTPMQWSPDRNAGFSKANPQRLFLPTIIDAEYLYESVNVETQRRNPQSLWWWMKRLIAMRGRYPALGRGSLEFLMPENNKVLVFVRTYLDQTILVVANLSRFAQCVEIDLAAFDGFRPVELFGRTKFPTIGKAPYVLTLGPHGFFWFEMERQQVLTTQGEGTGDAAIAKISLRSEWDELLQGAGKRALESALKAWLPERRWFGSKARLIQNVTIDDAVPLGNGDAERQLLALLRVDFHEGEPEQYQLPLAYAAHDELNRIAEHAPQAIVARLNFKANKTDGAIYDALWSGQFASRLLEITARKRRFPGAKGELVGTSPAALQDLIKSQPAPLVPSATRAEQSNSGIVFGDKLMLKLFRKVENGLNPDVEIGRFLTEETSFAHSPAVLGALEYRRPGEEPLSLGIFNRFLPSTITAWQYSLDALSRYFERVIALPPEKRPSGESTRDKSLYDLAAGGASDEAKELMWAFLESATLLGERTGQMHVALSTGTSEAFAPEPFSQLYQRSLFQSLRKSALQTFQLLRKRVKELPDDAKAGAETVLGREKQILDTYKQLVGQKLHALRIRCHGDYHLGQVLYTGSDFYIIDFEGEPAQGIAERRLKRCPLRDVAGMLRSLHYASSQACRGLQQTALLTSDNRQSLEAAAEFWYRWSASAFLRAYRNAAASGNFLPATRDEGATLLRVYLMEKAVYELGYELNNRPDWVAVPIAGLISLTH